MPSRFICFYDAAQLTFHHPVQGVSWLLFLSRFFAPKLARTRRRSLSPNVPYRAGGHHHTASPRRALLPPSRCLPVNPAPGTQLGMLCREQSPFFRVFDF